MTRPIRVQRIEIPEHIPTGWLTIFFYAPNHDALAAEIKVWLEGHYAKKAELERALSRVSEDVE